MAGADAVAVVEANLKTMQEQIDAHRELPASVTIDETGSPTVKRPQPSMWPARYWRRFLAFVLSRD